MAQYSGSLVKKILKVVLSQNSYCNTISQSIFLRSTMHMGQHGMPTFRTEVFRLVSNVQLVKKLLL